VNLYESINERSFRIGSMFTSQRCDAVSLTLTRCLSYIINTLATCGPRYSGFDRLATMSLMYYDIPPKHPILLRGRVPLRNKTDPGWRLERRKAARGGHSAHSSSELSYLSAATGTAAVSRKQPVSIYKRNRRQVGDILYIKYIRDVAKSGSAGAPQPRHLLGIGWRMMSYRNE
jgi:hypothetical protein